jgi:hypothetical protein
LYNRLGCQSPGSLNKSGGRCIIILGAKIDSTDVDDFGDKKIQQNQGKSFSRAIPMAIVNFFHQYESQIERYRANKSNRRKKVAKWSRKGQRKTPTISRFDHVRSY